MSFLASLPPYGSARDAAIFDAIRAGRIDPPTWVRVPVAEGIEVEVSSDYLMIDGERVPMAADVAQAAVDSLDGYLPTVAIVDAIERTATVLPLPTWAPAPGHDRGEQITTPVLVLCEQETRAMFAKWGIVAGQLVAGHRKDVVLAASMPAKCVVIYGARWPDGRRLQPLYAGHEAQYADYSHGVRAVRRCWVDGIEASLADLYQRAPLGPVAALRYPSRAPLASTVLRRGSQGSDVEALQRHLDAAGYPVTADGIFGPRTEAAVRRFQAAHGLTVDGIAGAATRAALRDDTPPTDRNPSAPVYPADVARALGLRPPLTEGEVDRVFGVLPWSPVPGDDSAIVVPASWQREHLVSVTIPQLAGIQGAPPGGRITIAKVIAEQTRALWAAWEAHGKLGLVRSWAGSVAFRRVRGGVLVSRHARGLAFDINVAWNGRGAVGAPRGAVGSVCDLLEELPAHGFASGGLYPLPDWMHVEAAEIV